MPYGCCPAYLSKLHVRCLVCSGQLRVKSVSNCGLFSPAQENPLTSKTGTFPNTAMTAMMVLRSTRQSLNSPFQPQPGPIACIPKLLPKNVANHPKTSRATSSMVSVGLEGRLVEATQKHTKATAEPGRKPETPAPVL